MDDPFDQFLNNLYSNYVDDVSPFLQAAETNQQGNSFHPSVFQKSIKEEPESSPPPMTTNPALSVFPSELPELSQGVQQNIQKKTVFQAPTSPVPAQSPSQNNIMSPNGNNNNNTSMISPPFKRKSPPKTYSSPDTVESSESDISSPSSSGEGTSPPQTAMQEILDLISWDEVDSFRPSKRKRESTNREAIKRKHNLAEQKRRIEMNDAIDHIRLLLPNGKEKSKSTKLAILIESFDYFKRIQELCCELVPRNRQLEEQVKVYKKLYGPLPPGSVPQLNPSTPTTPGVASPGVVHQKSHPAHQQFKQPQQQQFFQQPQQQAQHSQRHFNQSIDLTQSSPYLVETLQNIEQSLNDTNASNNANKDEMMGFKGFPSFAALSPSVPAAPTPAASASTPMTHPLSVNKIPNTLFYGFCIFGVLLFSPFNLKSLSSSSIASSTLDASRSLQEAIPLVTGSAPFFSMPDSFHLFVGVSFTVLVCFLFLVSILCVFGLAINFAPIWYVSREKRQFIREEVGQGQVYRSQGRVKEADEHYHCALRYLGLGVPDSYLLLCFCIGYQMFRKFLHVMVIGLILEKWVIDRKEKARRSRIEKGDEEEKQVEMLKEATKAYRGILSRHHPISLRYLYMCLCSLNVSESIGDKESLSTLYAWMSFCLFSHNTSSSTILQFLATYLQYTAWKVSSSNEPLSPPESSSLSSSSSSSHLGLKGLPESFQSSTSDLGQLYFVQGISTLLGCRLKEARFHLTRAFQIFMKNSTSNTGKTTNGSENGNSTDRQILESTSPLLPPSPKEQISPTILETELRHARFCAFSIGILSECEGKIRLSLSSYSYTLRSATENNDSKAIIWSLLGLSRCYLHLNKPQVSLQLLNELWRSTDLRHTMSPNDIFMSDVFTASSLYKLSYWDESFSVAKQAVERRKKTKETSLFWIVIIQHILTDTLLNLLETSIFGSNHSPEVDMKGSIRSSRSAVELRKEIPQLCALIEEMIKIEAISGKSSALIKGKRLRHKAEYYYLLGFIHHYSLLSFSNDKKDESKTNESETTQGPQVQTEKPVTDSRKCQSLQNSCELTVGEPEREVSGDCEIGLSGASSPPTAPISIPSSSSASSLSMSLPSSFPFSPSSSASTLPAISSPSSLPATETLPSTPTASSAAPTTKAAIEESRSTTKILGSLSSSYDYINKAKQKWFRSLELCRSLDWGFEEQILISQFTHYSLSLQDLCLPNSRFTFPPILFEEQNNEEEEGEDFEDDDEDSQTESDDQVSSSTSTPTPSSSLSSGTTSSPPASPTTLKNSLSSHLYSIPDEEGLFDLEGDFLKDLEKHLEDTNINNNNNNKNKNSLRVRSTKPTH